MSGRVPVEGSLLTITLNPALDICSVVPVLEPDRKMHCHDLSINPGGGGVNVARVAIRLGANAVAAVLAGGATGSRLRALLDEERVPVEIVPIAGEVRENFTAVESTSGRQYRFVLPGPTVSRQEWACAMDRLAAFVVPGSLVVVSGSLPEGVAACDLADLLARLQGAGARIIVDTSGDALRAAARVGTIMMKPSLRELSTFAGQPLNSHADITSAARSLLELGPNNSVIVSLAGAGALLVERQGPSQWIHAPQVRVVSTVGAGDSLVAGAAVTLLRGGPVLEAACVGVAAGSAATLAHGASLCRQEDVESMRPLVSVSRPQGH